MKWIKISDCMLKYDPDTNRVWGHGDPDKLVKGIKLAILKGSIPRDFSALIIYDDEYPDIPTMLRGPNLTAYLVAGPAPRESARTLSQIIDS